MIYWNLEKRFITDLKYHPKNPRCLSKDQYSQLKKSIDKFGFIEKVIINTDNVIIGGHQRIHVLKNDNVEEVECWVPSRTLDEKEVEELLIRLNRNHGEWNFDALANDFDVPDLLDYGFQPQELEIALENVKDKSKKKKKEKLCPYCGEVIS